MGRARCFHWAFSRSAAVLIPPAAWAPYSGVSHCDCHRPGIDESRSVARSSAGHGNPLKSASGRGFTITVILVWSTIWRTNVNHRDPVDLRPGCDLGRNWLEFRVVVPDGSALQRITQPAHKGETGKLHFLRSNISGAKHSHYCSNRLQMKSQSRSAFPGPPLKADLGRDKTWIRRRDYVNAYSTRY
jgi:hypothetical protein